MEVFLVNSLPRVHQGRSLMKPWMLVLDLAWEWGEISPREYVYRHP